MTRLNSLPVELQQSLEKRSVLKVISGLGNFDKLSVEMIARAAGRGGADLLDVACDQEVIDIAVKVSGLPVCVSAVEPELFPAAVKAGATMIEIGNFDSLYPKGRFFEAKEVLELTLKTRRLLPEVVLSVTVPHILPLDQQAQLALDLVDAGADLIQTEGGTSSRPFSPGSLGLIEKAAPTLAASYSINQALIKNGCHTPLLCASGLSEVTVPMAFATGAAGVGVGSAVNRLTDELSMLAVIRRLNEAILTSRVISEISIKN